jgi:hypothetical protein
MPPAAAAVAPKRAWLMQTLLTIIAGIAIAVCMVCLLIVIGQAAQTSPLKRKAETVASIADMVLIVRFPR